MIVMSYELCVSIYYKDSFFDKDIVKINVRNYDRVILDMNRKTKKSMNMKLIISTLEEIILNMEPSERDFKLKQLLYEKND